MASKVYAMGWSPTGPVKIGYANNTDKRLRDLQVGCPYPLVVFEEWSVTNQHLHNPLTGPKLEHILHKAFAGRRLRGEWFDISVDELHEFISSTAFAGGRVKPSGKN